MPEKILPSTSVEGLNRTIKSAPRPGAAHEKLWADKPEYVALLKTDDGIIPPHLVSAWSPAYPDALHDAGVRGTVDVSLVVERDGSVAAARVLGSNDSRFEGAALRSIRKWRFIPARDGSGPRAAVISQRIVFTPEGAMDRQLDAVEKSPHGSLAVYRYPLSRYGKLWADKPAYAALARPRDFKHLPRVTHQQAPVFPAGLFVNGGRRPRMFPTSSVPTAG